MRIMNAKKLHKLIICYNNLLSREIGMKRAIRISRGAAVGAVAAILFFTAYAAEQDQNKRDLDAMQGTWIFQKWMNEGISAPAEVIAGNKMTLTITGDQMTAIARGNEPAMIKLDSSKDPAAIDFIDKNKSVELGIYQIKDDILTFCINATRAGGGRPTVFESTRENGFMLVVMKRQALKTP
jgi:uncharacterized protein (TIGR03067 family)